VNTETSAEALIRELLLHRNQAAIRQLEEFTAAVSEISIPQELERYRKKVLSFACLCRDRAESNCNDLSLEFDELLDDLRSSTAQVIEMVRLITHLLAGPILRATEYDRLALKIIQWLHSTDAGTATLPAACRDGDPAVLPLLDFTPIYEFPSLAQRGLLFMALYIHEFGHVLYVLHKPEMDALVKELQEYIANELQPLSHRNDQRAKKQRELQQAVVLTWYEWIQELFCDSIGLTMGGPAYGFAFSEYLMRLDRGDFSLDRGDLAFSSHPVTWLRVQFVVARAHRLGYTAVAEAVRQQWSVVASSLHISEDYFGYFEPQWTAAVESCIDDMLTEASPYECKKSESAAEVEWSPGASPISLLNRAWKIAQDEKSDYGKWERNAVKEFVMNTNE
jgi:hypothetical protein